MLSASWIIIKLDTGEAILETWNESVLNNLKPEFKGIPTHEYLCNLNQKIKENSEQSEDTGTERVYSPPLPLRGDINDASLA